jgi:hypothetical protein
MSAAFPALFTTTPCIALPLPSLDQPPARSLSLSLALTMATSHTSTTTVTATTNSVGVDGGQIEPEDTAGDVTDHPPRFSAPFSPSYSRSQSTREFKPRAGVQRVRVATTHHRHHQQQLQSHNDLCLRL